jgi:hypothetical protein
MCPVLHLELYQGDEGGVFLYFHILRLLGSGRIGGSLVCARSCRETRFLSCMHVEQYAHESFAVVCVPFYILNCDKSDGGCFLYFHLLSSGRSWRIGKQYAHDLVRRSFHMQLLVLSVRVCRRALPLHSRVLCARLFFHMA